MKHEEVSHLRGLEHGRYARAVAYELGEGRLGGNIVVPHVVVYGLEVPDQLPRRAAQRQHGAGVLVETEAMTPPVVR